MTRPMCDFCTSPEIAWTYPTRDLSSTVPLPGKNATVTINSTGGWAACKSCRDLIEAGDREALAVRSGEASKQGDVPLHMIVTACRIVQDDFWANREGPPVPTSPGDNEDPTRPHATT